MTMESFDVVIVGAGISGIGAAWHLQKHCPSKRWVILEGREALGGTWDLFRYPGIRSDSDMHTLGYGFKPWLHRKAIADGPSIRDYLNETATENGIDRHIRYGLRVTRASWSTRDAAWTVEAEQKQTGAPVKFTCNFLWLCAGYYSYENPYTPDFPGRERFQGTVVHPQHWPPDLEVRGKRVIVIGSGATAATLVPELAETAGHVVMLQRSPTYFISMPDVDAIANLLRRWLPERVAYAFTRWKNVHLQQMIYRLARRRPQLVKKILIGRIRRELGPSFDIETHFTPRYTPWEQRLCLITNGNLFKALRSGKASMATDHVETFTEKGLLLKSGRELQADVVITATGLNLQLYGGVDLSVDERSVDVAKRFGYKGMMVSDVPNLVSTFGYVNASWTLRADLTAEWVCSVLNLMDKKRVRQCTPRLRESDQGMPERPFIEDFSSGYIQRALHLMPKQGDREPWVNPHDYLRDRRVLRQEPVEDGVLRFENSR